MLLIDKSKTQVRLLITISDVSMIENAYYLLVLKSAYTNKTFRFNLPVNTSSFPERFDEFIFNIEIFKELEAGTYNYSVYESIAEIINENVLGEPIETGLLKVIDHDVLEFLSPNVDETDDDYITYNG